MTIQIDRDANALYIELLKDTKAADTLELSPDIYVDIDDHGNVIGIEVLHLSDHPQLEIPGFAMPASLDDARAFSAQFAA